jgi:AraC family transcriptional regulator
MKLVGLNVAMSFGDSAIRQLWQAFGPMVAEVTNRVSQDFISMRIYDPPPRTPPPLDSPFVQWAAVEVADFDRVPHPLQSHVLSGGLYAVFEHHGTPASFGRTAEQIFEQWLPNSPYELAPRPYFEVLGPNYRPDDPKAHEEIWIPVQART